MKFVSAAHLTGGGTITGDLTISGDLTVSGGGDFSYSEVLTGDMKITNALSTIGLEINQDTNYSALKIDHDGVTSAASLYFANPTTTTGSIIHVDDCSSLTSGKIANLYSNAASTTARNLVIITNDNPAATGTVPLWVQQDSTGKSIFVDHNISSTTAGTYTSAHIDVDRTGAVTSGTDVITGLDLDVNNTGAGTSGTPTVTTYGIDMDIVGDNAGSGTSKTVGLDIAVSGADTNYAALFNGGNVGIGTSTPTEKLEINGDLRLSVNPAYIGFGSAGAVPSAGDYIKLEDVGSGGTAFEFAQDGSVKFAIQGTTGNVGIGVTDPDTLLHLESSTSLKPVLRLENTNADQHNAQLHFIKNTSDEAAGDHLGQIDWKGNNDAGDLELFGRIQVDSVTVGNGTETGKMMFSVRATSDTTANRMVLDGNSRISLSNNDAGDNNTIFGKSAGASLDSSSDENTFIGGAVSDGAMDAALRNVGIGYNALGGLTQGDDNIAIGVNALLVNGAGTQNVVIGNYAGDALGSWYNVLIGHSAGSAGITSHGQIAIGNKALLSSTSGANNVAIGSYDGAINAALQTNTVGSYNIAIGAGALTAANDNANDGTVAIGHLACTAQVVTAGLQFAGATTAVGYKALTALTTGAGNTAIGFESLSTVTTGANNVALGYGAANAFADSENNNVAIGVNAMGSVDRGTSSGTAEANVCIGTSAGLGGDYSGNARHFTNNVLIGNQAGDGSGVQDCYSNVFLGNSAGGGTYSTGGSTYNIGIGQNALAGALTAASNNIAIGTSTFGSVSSGSSNVAIGGSSGGSLTTGSSNTLVGHGVDVDDAGQKSQTVIGNSGTFRFLSKEYTCDFCKNDDGDVASSNPAPLKIPAYSVIKSVSVIIKTLSDLTEYDVAIVHSSSSGAVSDDAAPAGTPVEILGAGSSTTKRGSDGTATDINLAVASQDGIVKQSYYNGFDGNGLHVGTADRYVHIVNADGNGDSNPSTDGVIKVLVEYVGLD
jgi:hypothetical protein